MANQFDKLLSSSSRHLCAIAGPGSGKTSRLLIPKATEILSDAEVKPEEVLLLTFSRLSAQDLRQKAKTLERVPKATTVHSFALAFLLSEDNHDIRKRVESIVLDFEKESLLSDLKVTFPKRYKKDLGKDLDAFSAGWATQPHDEVFEEDDDRKAFKAAVVNWLVEHEAAMMEEILYFAVDLAKKIPAAGLLQEPQYILTDEYQDLNRLEQDFVDAVAKESKLLVVVGDPDQSIYSFKYAHPEGIKAFASRAGVDTHNGMTTWRCPKRVVGYANQLLKQIDPARTVLLETPPSAIDGDVVFIRRDTQEQEFEYVLSSIAGRLASGAPASEVIALVPRKKLGADFVAYANEHRAAVGIPDHIDFCLSVKPDFTDSEKERILQFALTAKPDSLLHLRAYLGLGDATEYAKEVAQLKATHGGLASVLAKAMVEGIPAAKVRLRRVAQRVEALRAFLSAHQGDSSVADLIDELFPGADQQMQGVRSVLLSLVESGDTIASVYGKFVDYMRTIPNTDTQVRVMTLMASKGLEADHVYIMGCNAGNLPGENRSPELTALQHRHEQLRLLYVAFTRAKKWLTVSWSQHLPFAQSKTHHTSSVGTVTKAGKAVSKVGICAFLQDLTGVQWK